MGVLQAITKYTLLLLLAIPIGCGSVSTGSRGPSQEATPGIQRMFKARKSVCILRVKGSQGSAVSLLKDGNHTYLGTAAHMVDESAVGDVVQIEWYDRGRHFGEAKVYAVSATDDIAILVTGSPVPVASFDDRKLSPPMEVSSIGCPMGMFPPNVSVGYLVKGHEGMYSSSATSWFGNSGGALVDFSTGYVIGILVHLHGDGISALSVYTCSVPMYKLVEFGKEVFKIRRGR